MMPEFSNKIFSSSNEMCKTILKDTGVALLPGSDFGFSEKRMLARLSFTDFDGVNFMNDVKKNKSINIASIDNFAPKIIEGTKRLREWAESA